MNLQGMHWISNRSCIAGRNTMIIVVWRQWSSLIVTIFDSCLVPET